MKHLFYVLAITCLVSCQKDDYQMPEPERPVMKLAEYQQLQGSTKLYYSGDTLVKSEMLFVSQYTNQLEYTWTVDYRYTDNKLTGYTKNSLHVNGPDYLIEEAKLEYDNNGFLIRTVFEGTNDTLFWTTTAKGEITGYRHNHKIGEVGAWEFDNEGNAIPSSYITTNAGSLVEINRGITYSNEPNIFYPYGEILLIAYRYLAGNFYQMLSRKTVTQFTMATKITEGAPGNNITESSLVSDFTYKYDETGALKSYRNKYKNEEFYNGVKSGNNFDGDETYEIKWYNN